MAIFGYFVSTQYFSDLTDINLKQMMFEQKMQEIENDVVPFGFIDDGEEAIVKIENEDDPWRIQEDTRRFIFDPDDLVL
mgnify:CR=1 FL=1